MRACGRCSNRLRVLNGEPEGVAPRCRRPRRTVRSGRSGAQHYAADEPYPEPILALDGDVKVVRSHQSSHPSPKIGTRACSTERVTVRDMSPGCPVRLRDLGAGLVVYGPDRVRAFPSLRQLLDPPSVLFGVSALSGIAAYLAVVRGWDLSIADVGG
jgi:hypothetical protein